MKPANVCVCACVCIWIKRVYNSAIKAQQYNWTDMALAVLRLIRASENNHLLRAKFTISVHLSLNECFIIVIILYRTQWITETAYNSDCFGLFSFSSTLLLADAAVVAWIYDVSEWVMCVAVFADISKRSRFQFRRRMPLFAEYSFSYRWKNYSSKWKQNSEIRMKKKPFT